MRSFITVDALHFGLSYAADHETFHLETGDDTYVLVPHTPDTRAAHRTKNRALALFDDEQMARVTHFVENVRLPAAVARILRVVAPEPGAPLPTLVGYWTYIPPEPRRANRAAQLDRLAGRRHPLLGFLGVEAELSGDELLDVWADADKIAESPYDTAVSLTFSHPQMASRDPQTAAVVVDDHISTAQDIYSFAYLISSLGPASESGGWATITESVDQYGDPLGWGPGYEAEGYQEGDPVYYYDLSEEVTGAGDTPPSDTSGLSVVNESLRTTQDDVRLENQSWAVFQGTPDLRRSKESADAAAKALVSAAKAEEFRFTLNNRTPGYGLQVPKESIVFAPDAGDPRRGDFTIDAKNNFLRTLVAYVEFLDSNGRPIDNPPGWVENLPAFPPFLREDFETASKKYLSSVTAVSTILGIPVPTDPTVLDFPWPAEATSCRLYFGGLGTRNWDGVVDPGGILLTGIFQYGIPSLFLLAGAAITSSAWFKDFVSKTDNVVAALAVAFPIVGGGVATAAALTNTKRVLAAFASAIAGIIVGKGLEKLAAYVLAKMTASQLAAAVPYVGFAFKMANMAISAANLAETTVEVLISPATYTIDVQRQIALEATVHPDPLHGTSTQPAVWPKVATHWVATVQYRNGTNYTVTGMLPEEAAKRSDPVVVQVPELPGGSQLQVSFGVYSPTDWLAGRWTSAWIDAVAPDGSGGVLHVAGQIQEELVPLTPSTQYLYSESLAYDAGSGSHVWKKGAQPTATVASLTGGPLSELVDLTLNDKAYMLGYTWRAADQNLPFCGSSDPTEGQIYAFQNISTLALPEQALKFPSCGFSAQPYLVYDQFGPAPLFSVDGSFQESLDQGQVTEPLRAAFEEGGYPLPEATSVEVVQPTVRWFLDTGLPEPTYDLRRDSSGRIGVFQYPTPEYSPNNFYVDPRSGVYHLRRVVLDEKTPFDMSPTLSYGYFTEAHLDSVVIHPAGYAVGVNYRNHKMEIIQLPDVGVPDAAAQPASLVAGKGVRQGLLQGPRAIAVTADGRLLVLESTNRRIQAFDLNGNPVASFDGGLVTTVEESVFAPELDQGLVTMALIDRFAQGGVDLAHHWNIADAGVQYDLALAGDGLLNVQGDGADLSSEWVIADEGESYDVRVDGDHLAVATDPPFEMPLEFRATLDRTMVDESIVQAFADHGITLSDQAEVAGNGLHLPASYQDDLARGVISADLEAAFATRDVVLGPDAVLTSRLSVDVQRPGDLWVISDRDAARSYRVSVDPADASKLRAVRWEPTMALHAGSPGEQSTFLDLATEMRGYVYVLSYVGDGTNVSDYKLDLYTPDGEWLSRTPDTSIEPNATGVNGARLIVDMWRSLYTLDYAWFEGPGGRTEPSVSTWLPTTPEGEE